MKLAAEGGYDAVQMREIARLSEMSLHTLYRYYPSKDDIILIASTAEVERLRLDVISRPPSGKTPGDRAATALMRAFRVLHDNRGFAHAVATCYHVPAAFNPEFDDEATQGPDFGKFEEVVALATWGPDHLITREQQMALRALSSVFVTALISWLNGTLGQKAIGEQFSFAAHRLIDLPAEDRTA
ncbi:TetR family transcriptional regulator [Nocardia sp. bgisy134]|uniref:TetR family transcriptional regulator n=1 Tax=Nocardia sp. bgisy134 TaxID=3413789 RepID=UPI003D71C46B